MLNCRNRTRLTVGAVRGSSACAHVINPADSFRMKTRLLLIPLFAAVFAMTTSGERVPSGVWRVAEQSPVIHAAGQARQFFAGSGADVAFLSARAVMLAPGDETVTTPEAPDTVKLLVVTAGRLQMALAAETREIGPGGLALALESDEVTVRNMSGEPATYYEFHYRSDQDDRDEITDTDPERKLSSRLIAMADAAFVANPRGGWRGYYNGHTRTLRLFELHETTLIGGVQNHPVHTHDAEEMVLMLDGHVELEIDGVRHEGRPGDVFFVQANASHTLFTLGEKPSRYLAFQWR